MKLTSTWCKISLFLCLSLKVSKSFNRNVLAPFYYPWQHVRWKNGICKQEGVEYGNMLFLDSLGGTGKRINVFRQTQSYLNFQHEKRHNNDSFQFLLPNMIVVSQNKMVNDTPVQQGESGKGKMNRCGRHLNSQSLKEYFHSFPRFWMRPYIITDVPEQERVLVTCLLQWLLCGCDNNLWETYLCCLTPETSSEPLVSAAKSYSLPGCLQYCLYRFSETLFWQWSVLYQSTFCSRLFFLQWCTRSLFPSPVTRHSLL